MWGHHIADPLALMFYFLNQLGIALALALKLEIAVQRGQVRYSRESDLARLRLWLMCAVMAVSAAATRVLPIKFIGLAALAMGLLARTLRAKQKRKWERLESTRAAAQPPSLRS